jgi:SnoaL-like domain
MRRPAFACFVAVLFLAGLPMPQRARAQEIPLERCDSLPLVRVDVDGRAMHFLVDTAATSLLNLKSFGEGRGRDIRVTSWSGTVATSAREISVNEIVVGQTKLIFLKIPAIDLSAIGKACGRKIDGVLGADLLAKIGATIDLKRHTMHLTTVDEERDMQLAKETGREMTRCVRAFNDSDEFSFADCLEPQITFFAGSRTLSGRESVARYFSDNYFHQTPAATLEISESVFHPVGEAVWYEYEFTVQLVGGLLRGRGVALCRKSGGRWRITSMHHSDEHFESGIDSR